jgi:hypothetical protein
LWYVHFSRQSVQILKPLLTQTLQTITIPLISYRLRF